MERNFVWVIEVADCSGKKWHPTCCWAESDREASRETAERIKARFPGNKFRVRKYVREGSCRCKK